MADPIIVVTDQGNRLNEAAAVAAAQAVSLLDSTGTALGTVALAAPRSAALQYAHKLFADMAFIEEQQKQAEIAKHAIATELELVQHIEHLMDAALAVGMKFTVTLDANGKMVPAAMKA